MESIIFGLKRKTFNIGSKTCIIQIDHATNRIHHRFNNRALEPSKREHPTDRKIGPIKKHEHTDILKRQIIQILP